MLGALDRLAAKCGTARDLVLSGVPSCNIKFQHTDPVKIMILSSIRSCVNWLKLYGLAHARETHVAEALSHHGSRLLFAFRSVTTEIELSSDSLKVFEDGSSWWLAATAKGIR